MRSVGGDFNKPSSIEATGRRQNCTSRKGDCRSFRRMSSSEPPTGIMTSFDSVGEMVYLLLNRLSMKVPGEVSLISFGGTRRATTIQRSLSSLR